MRNNLSIKLDNKFGKTGYLDNDKDGFNTVNKLLTCNKNIKNKSLEMHSNHKDFNHFLISNRNK